MALLKDFNAESWSPERCAASPSATMSSTVVSITGSSFSELSSNIVSVSSVVGSSGIFSSSGFEITVLTTSANEDIIASVISAAASIGLVELPSDMVVTGLLVIPLGISIVRLRSRWFLTLITAGNNCETVFQ